MPSEIASPYVTYERVLRTAKGRPCPSDMPRWAQRIPLRLQGLLAWANLQVWAWGEDCVTHTPKPLYRLVDEDSAVVAVYLLVPERGGGWTWVTLQGRLPAAHASEVRYADFAWGLARDIVRHEVDEAFRAHFKDPHGQ